MAYYGAELWIEEEAGIGTERGVVKRSNDGERFDSTASKSTPLSAIDPDRENERSDA